MKKTPKTTLRRLELADMDAAARLHRTAFDDALLWLTGLHTLDEDQWFYRERVFTTCQMWGAFDETVLSGIIAFRTDWIEQLYVLPEAQGAASGVAATRKTHFDRLQLWTFQRNLRAQRFYQAKGFVLVEQTDGAGNEEKEPDAHYLWTRP